MTSKSDFSRDEIKVFIVEDHPIFRSGLAQLIENESGMGVCGESEEHLDALNRIKKIKPDLVIVDLSLKDSSGMELIKDLKLYMPDVKILTISMHDENIYAERVLRSGAKGYIMKQEAPETIITAIRQVMNGRVYVSENIQLQMLNKFVDGKDSHQSSPLDLLSDRELEVFELIGNGFSTRQISDKLHISIKTVENHRAHIKDKLNISNSIELIRQATIWVQQA